MRVKAEKPKNGKAENGPPHREEAEDASLILIQLRGVFVEVGGLETFTEFCPAKINPYLAVTGRRGDGFHELVSVVAPISVGDTLEVTAAEAGFSLSCDDPDLPTDGSNLVMKAAEMFRRKSGWKGGAEFRLQKRVPSGAGLGGGSSDAMGALRALNRLSGELLDPAALQEVAAEIGSDCPLFLHDGPVVMRGRGELIELNDGIAATLRGRRTYPAGIPAQRPPMTWVSIRLPRSWEANIRRFRRWPSG